MIVQTGCPPYLSLTTPFPPISFKQSVAFVAREDNQQFTAAAWLLLLVFLQ